MTRAALLSVADELAEASSKAALECAVAALNAARARRLGQPASMGESEGEALWLESSRLLREFGHWPFPAVAR
jgi:hypothetical protein